MDVYKLYYNQSDLSQQMVRMIDAATASGALNATVWMDPNFAAAGIVPADCPVLELPGGDRIARHAVPDHVGRLVDKPAKPPGSPAPGPAAAPRAPVEYVLYASQGDMTPTPPNGSVSVQPYERVKQVIGPTLPRYLQSKRPLPVLVTLEQYPTVWYGRAARDQCRLLCLLCDAQ